MTNSLVGYTSLSKLTFNSVILLGCFYINEILSVSILSLMFFLYLLIVVLFCTFQLYVPDEDKSIFGRSVNKQVFEGFTTGLLQTIATILKSLYLCVVEPAKCEIFQCSSSDAKGKGSAAESYSTRAQDLIRYFSSVFNSRFLNLPHPPGTSLSHPQNLFTSFLSSSSLPLMDI